jgi:hypothetical protein
VLLLLMIIWMLRFIPVATEEHPMVAAAAADATQWILAEELGYKLDELPGWDDLGKWNFSEVDAPEKVCGSFHVHHKYPEPYQG